MQMLKISCTFKLNYAIRYKGYIEDLMWTKHMRSVSGLSIHGSQLLQELNSVAILWWRQSILKEKEVNQNLSKSILFFVD